MPIYQTILVVHPAAIGDAVMGTPVARTLKARFPDAKIIYLTHASLFPLLELCRSIDIFLEWSRDKAIATIIKQVREHRPQLTIDLVGSPKTRLISALSGGKVLTWRKHKNPRNWAHVVDNYLSTLEPLKPALSAAAFPSLIISKEALYEIEKDDDLGNGRDLIALVPGVGVHRPNRSWPPEKWVELGGELCRAYASKIVLIGGADDRAVCRAVKSKLGDRCIDKSGRMTLVETAAVLSCAKLVISADTGPAHIACAVGTKVICLTGPTDARRTGPYRQDGIGISAYERCRCRNAKRCLLAGEGGSGQCMATIETAEVMSQVRQTMLLLDGTRSGA